jgi:hypothetical protein
VAKRQAARSEAERSEAEKPHAAKPQKPRPEVAKPEIGYAPTGPEQAAIDKVRQAGQGPRVKVSKNGDGSVIAPDHVDEVTGYFLLMEALGTTDSDFLIGLLGQLGNAGSQGRELDPVGINFMISVIKGIQPRDQVEAMLASQMAAVHMASMTFARRLAHVESIRQQDSAERALTKLTRTFAAQMEALKRYRTGGEQKVTVQHVTVSEGGQAIVGNVTQGSREAAANKSPASQPLLADVKTAPMPIIDEQKRVPVPALKKNEAVPEKFAAARRRGRRRKDGSDANH